MDFKRAPGIGLKSPYLDDRGDEPTVGHCDRNGNIDVLIVCDALAISRARCT